jgi:tape measure domain-containing protein
MSTSVGSIHYDLSLDTSRFDAQSAALSNNISSFKDKFSSFATTMGSSALKASAGLAALGVVLSPIIKDAVARVDTLSNAPKVLQNLGFSAEDSAASMKILDKSIRGLPTSLDDATTALLQITAASGRTIKESTKLTVAFNNMALAGGRGPQEAQRALIQFTQALGRGKMGMQEFNTLSEVMPAQLQQVAKTTLGAGANISTLREALSDGTLTMAQFADAIVSLDKKGGNGFASFEQQARTATGGIATSFVNMKTAMTRGMAEIIKSIGTDKIKNALNTIGKTMEKVSKVIAKNVDIVAVFIGTILTVAFISLSVAVISATYPILLFAAAITAAYMVVKRYETGARELMQTFKELYNSTAGFREFIANEFITVWNELKGALNKLRPEWLYIQDHLGEIMTVMKVLATVALAPLISFFMNLLRLLRIVSWTIKTSIDIYIQLKDTIVDLKNTFVNSFNIIKTAVTEFKKDTVEAFQNTKTKISENIDKIQNKFEIFRSKLESIQKTTSKSFDGGKGTEEFISKIDAINEKLAGFINTTLERWKKSSSEGMKNVKDSIVNGWQESYKGTKEKLSGIADSIEKFVKDIPDKFKNVAKNIKNNFTEGFDKIKDDTKKFVSDIGKDFDKIDDNIKESLKRFKESVSNFFKDLGKNIKKDTENSGKENGNNFADGIKNKMTAMETVRKVGDAILTLIALAILAIIVYVADAALRLGGKIISGISDAISQGKETVRSALSRAMAAIGEFMGGAGNWLTTHGTALINGFANSIRNAYWTVWHGVQGAMGSIGHFMGGVGGWLWESGKALISGFVGGIYAMYWAPYNAIKDMLGRVRGLFPRSPAKEGPFSGKGWTLYSGMSLADGFADGISKNIGNVQSAANSMMEAATIGNISNSMNTAMTGTMPLGPGANVSQETTTNNNIYGNITLGDTAAVDTFFNRLDRNGELARKGMATI